MYAVFRDLVTRRLEYRPVYSITDAYSVLESVMRKRSIIPETILADDGERIRIRLSDTFDMVDEVTSNWRVEIA